MAGGPCGACPIFVRSFSCFFLLTTVSPFSSFLFFFLLLMPTASPSHCHILMYCRQLAKPPKIGGWGLDPRRGKARGRIQGLAMSGGRGRRCGWPRPTGALAERGRVRPDAKKQGRVSGEGEGRVRAWREKARGKAHDRWRTRGIFRALIGFGFALASRG